MSNKIELCYLCNTILVSKGPNWYLYKKKYYCSKCWINNGIGFNCAKERQKDYEELKK